MTHLSPPVFNPAQLSDIRPGELTLFTSSSQCSRLQTDMLNRIAVSLGMRFKVRLAPTASPLLDGMLFVRTISLLTDDARPTYAAVTLDRVTDPADAARFLRGRLMSILDPDTPLVSLYTPPEPKPDTHHPFHRFNNCFTSLIESDSKACVMADDDDYDDFDNDALCNANILPTVEAPCSTSAEPLFDEAISLSQSPLPAAVFSETDAEQSIQLEKKEWVDRLTSMVLEYVTRFHEAPPMHLVEAEIRGKLLIAPQPDSPIHVSGDMHIFLPAFNELELRMTPLARTIYILFLMHPEGIRLKEIDTYARQISEIYSMVKPGADEQIARDSINALIDPAGESLQQKLSLSRAAIRRQILHAPTAERYLISGTPGGLYRINIDPANIHLPDYLLTLI